MTKHYYYIVPEPLRFKVIRDLLINTPDSLGLVFCHSKKEVDALIKQLDYQFPIGGLHGDTPKQTREKILTDWSNQALRLLITTLSTGQSLAHSQVEFLFHYQLPPNAKDYLQALKEMPSNQGVVVTLLNPGQEAFFKRLQESLDFELLKHPDCSAEFVDADTLGAMTKQGQKDPILGKKNAFGSGNPNKSPKGNTPTVPSRHV